MAKPAAAPLATEGFLPYQQVLIAHKTAGHSLRALGEKSGIDNSLLSRATTQPGRELDIETLKRLVPHVPGLRDALGQQWAEQLATNAAELGIALPAADEAAADGRTMLSFRDIRQSQYLNPRKVFDPDAIAELADSIAEHGLLQNLTVREAAACQYEIVAGERRWRAIGNLIEERRWAAEEKNIPVAIISADDAKARSIALLENLQRIEITPLEEARAFAELQLMDPGTWTTQAIARAIGKDHESGGRYVLQRLSLVYKLNAEVRDLLEAGTITFEKARFLTQFAPAAQDAIVVEIERNDPDLHGLYDSFRARAQAIADAIAPKPDKPKADKAKAARPQATSRDDGNPAEGSQDDARPYRASLAPGEFNGAPPPAEPAEHDAADLARGLPDPSTWELQTSTERLLTITLRAPSQEAFEAALRLFASSQTTTEAA